MTKDGNLDYDLLWSVCSALGGFDKQKKQAEMYNRVKEAYDEYSEKAGQDLSQGSDGNVVIHGYVNTKTKAVSKPRSPVSWITYEKGDKGDNDWIIKAWGRVVTFQEVAELVVALYQNEERIYPKPKYKGGDMLLEFLHECILSGGVTWNVMRKYKLVPDF